MCTLQEQAKKFLSDHNATMTIEYLDEEENFNSPHYYGNVYKVVIKRNGEEMTVTFHDSIYNRVNGIEPDEYDVLACLQKWEPWGNVLDFAFEHGYNEAVTSRRISSDEIIRIYEAVKEEYADVMRLFGDCIEELQEIQ